MNSMKDDMIQVFYEELLLRKKSQRTIKSYLGCMKIFFESDFGEEFSAFHVRSFLLDKHQRENLSASTLNMYRHAFQTFSRLVLRRSVKLDIPVSKRPQKLPVVLSREEVELLLKTILNRKHFVLVALAYGAGLRISEVLRLRVGDLDSERGVLHVKGAKGDKDRMTIFPERLREDILYFSRGKQGGELLFPSNRGGRLSSRSLSKVFERALRSTGITKPATFHSLRHSFATHLIEKGTNLRYVQHLLGHSNVRTTQIYTKVAKTALLNIQSPFS